MAQRLPGGYSYTDGLGRTKPGYVYLPGSGWQSMAQVRATFKSKGATPPAFTTHDPPKGMPGTGIKVKGTTKVVPNPVPLKLPGGKRVQAGGVDIGTLNVRALQQHLRHEGYDITVDGKLGAVTKAALADYMNPAHVGDTLAQAMKGTRFTGARDPKAFNAKYGDHPVKAFKPRSKLLDKNGNDPTAPGAQASVPNPDASGHVTAVNPHAGFKMTPENTALLGASLLDPKLADKIAGMQYDANIHDLGVQQARQPRVAAQDLADIKSWYGQALASLGVAGTRDKAASAAGENSIVNATKALVGSIGGSANQGSGSVAAAGNDAAGTIQALGTAEDQYNADMGPIMRMAQAGASASERARQTQAVQDMAVKMEDLKGQRGDAKAQALMQILQANNTTKDNRLQSVLGIRQANNQLTEQEFQNQLAEQQAQEAAASLGLKMQKYAFDASKPARGSFDASQPTVKNSAASQARSSIVDPTTGKLNVAIPGAVARVNATIRSFGWSLANPKVMVFRNNILHSAGIAPPPGGYAVWH